MDPRSYETPAPCNCAIVTDAMFEHLFTAVDADTPGPSTEVK